MGKRRNLEEYIQEATRNVREDRALAKSLLVDTMNDMKMSDNARKEMGSIAAKYIENLQRSNEQMVKVASLVQKEEKTTDGLSEADMENIFSMIDKEKEDGD